MINAILVVIFYLACVSSSSFACDSGLCFGIKLISAVLLVLRLFIKTNIGKKQLDKINGKFSKKLLDVLVCIASCAIIAILFFMAFSAKTTIAKAGLLNFDDKISEIDKLVDDGKTTKALEKVKELKESYGTNDRILQEEALVQIAASNYKDAQSVLSSLSDKKTEEYYLLSEDVMKGINADTVENTDSITNFYIEQVKNFPDWAYAQRQAGIAQVYNKNYEIAEYYLKRAYDIDPSDPLTSYNIGAAIIEQGENTERYIEAMEYFESAIDCGADESTKSYIAWYLEKIKGEEE